MGSALVSLVEYGDSRLAEGWADRCSYWLSVPTTPKRTGRPRRRNHAPLILTGHGMHLRVSSGALLVRGGCTHYPQQQEEWRLFPGDPKLPSRIVVVDGSGSISFDVLDWLSAQKVPLIRINWRGEIQSVLGGTTYSADPIKVDIQREAQRTRAASIAKALIGAKIANSIETLKCSIPASHQRQKALSALGDAARQLNGVRLPTLRGLLGIEGRVAFHYFRAWHSMPLRWKGLGRKPIPADWRHVGPRQSAIGNKIGSRNRRASHPVNAMLNYAYAILESQIRIQVACEGYDPTIGFLHSSKPDRDAFVLDLMEPMRPIVDRKVLDFVQSHTFHSVDFTIRSDGVCRLNPELAKSIVELSSAVWLKQINSNALKSSPTKVGQRR
ncbi:MAG: CRISPR-associated endonuclease Cas1 [Rudaea sp.]